jgi:aquaporin Z
MPRLIAEFLGTLILVLFGCGAAVLGGDHVGQLGVTLSFGFAIVALAYGLAILAAIAGSTGSLGQNGWGPGYGGEFTLGSAAVFEVVMTALFVLVILGSTAPRAPDGFAGLAIGITLAAIHIVGIQVTGVSVNPARSFGPAVLAGGQALSQLWLFIVAPLARRGAGRPALSAGAADRAAGPRRGGRLPRPSLTAASRRRPAPARPARRPRSAAASGLAAAVPDGSAASPP